MPFELSSAATIILPPQTNAVFHLAANTSFDSGENDESEMLAAQALLAAAQQVGAKFVFISSQTARADAPTPYGRTKWRIEQEVLVAGGWVVRPGQVYGGCERGLFGTLAGVVRRFPVLPAFLPAPKVQPIHVDDLAEGLLRIVERDAVSPGVLCLASPEPVPFTCFLLAVASARVRRQRWFVPLPVMFVKAIGAVLGDRLRKRLGLEQLSSLVDLPLMDTAHDLQRLGISLRSFRSGMHPSGNDRRRRLLWEGQALLAYVLKDRPDPSLLRRYVRAIEKLHGGSPLDIPELVLRLPITLALFDDRVYADHGPYPSAVWRAALAWRLDVATGLAEATTQGAYRFLGLGRSNGPILSLVCIAGALAAEIVWRVLRVVSAPFLRRCMRNAVSQR
jgi:NADH dehydrogenase